MYITGFQPFWLETLYSQAAPCHDTSLHLSVSSNLSNCSKRPREAQLPSMSELKYDDLKEIRKNKHHKHPFRFILRPSGGPNLYVWPLRFSPFTLL